MENFNFFKKSNQCNKEVLIKSELNSLSFEKFKFTKEDLFFLKKENFSLDLDENSEILELHINNPGFNLNQFRNDLKLVAENLDFKNKSYVIGISWLSKYLEFFGFKVEDVNPEILKKFPAGEFVSNQEKHIKDFLEKLERLQSKNNIKIINDNNEEEIISNISILEKEELQKMDKLLQGYEKIFKKNNGKLELKDIKLASMSYEDFLTKYKND